MRMNLWGFLSRIKQAYKNHLKTKNYALSWVGHCLFFYFASLIGLSVFQIIGASLGVGVGVAIGAAIGQEGTQFDVFRKAIPWYDYVMDIVSDIIGISLAYLTVTYFI